MSSRRRTRRVTSGRSGKSRIGLLVALVVLAAAGYCGFAFGSVYWRKYRVQEITQQGFAFAGQLTVEAIQRKVLDDLAGLQLPASRRVQWVQTERPRSIGVTITYVETVDLVVTQVAVPVEVAVRRVY